MPDEPRERPFILQWRSAVLNAPLTSTQKLCLLVLAEWADADGTNCWPAMEKIAERASVNEKTVRRSMDEVGPMGWFTRSHRRTQKGWKQFEYTLRLPDAADTVSCRARDAPGTVSGSDVGSTGHPVHLHRTLTSSAPGTVSTDLALPSQDLSKEEISPPVEKAIKAKGKKLTFQQWIQSLPAGQMAIPADDPIFTYAQDVGIPGNFLRLCWFVFADRYIDNQKHYSDWRAVFRNAVRGNWMKLWWIDGGVYELTTAGKQADIEHGTEIRAESTPDSRRIPESLIEQSARLNAQMDARDVSRAEGDLHRMPQG